MTEVIALNKLLAAHFEPVALEELVITRRDFPHWMRPDLHQALESVFNGLPETRFNGVRVRNRDFDFRFADLAEVYGVTTKVLNQAVGRNADRFPADFAFRLTSKEKIKVVTICDHLARLKFSPVLPRAFTEYGAIMVATVLNSPQAVAMSVYVVRAFVRMREQLASNTAIRKRLAEIDRTLLQHDASLRDIYRKLLALLQPPPDPPGGASGSPRTTDPPGHSALLGGSQGPRKFEFERKVSPSIMRRAYDSP